MNKENNKSAAGLRRSAIAERIRLREEWSALKGADTQAATAGRSKHTGLLTKKQTNIANNIAKRQPSNQARCKANVFMEKQPLAMQLTSEALRGVVALVETGSEPRALPLRAALSALGASVLPAWSPLVTHLIWTQGGCRATRARARALASRLVSPLWVEACAAAGRRLPEQAFPAAARSSDLPSPRTLRQLLKKAEMENIPLLDLLSDSKEDDKDPKMPRLRISSETEQDTSTDKTTDTSHDTSHDKSDDTTGIESRVNTAPRRALPTSISMSPHPDRPTKSRRKLFTQKEAEIIRRGSDSESEDQAVVPKPVKHNKLTQRERKDLAKAERMARRLLTACTNTVNKQTTKNVPQTTVQPRIVLTGMSRTERHATCEAIRSLGGRIQSRVNKRTSHVLLGSCRDDRGDRHRDQRFDITGITTHPCTQDDSQRVVHRSEVQKARTLNALVGAARGCRVLTAQWAVHSATQNKWLHHCGYEVSHLKKISQKARVERSALCRQRSEYAYDVFNGIRVYVSPASEQKDGAVQLLALCGAVLQDGGVRTEQFDVIIGASDGEVSSKWVFDSVAAGRMRTTRRYINNSLPSASNMVSTQGTVR